MSLLGIPKLKRRLSINTLTETLDDQELQCRSLTRRLNKVEEQLKDVHAKVISKGKQYDDLEILIQEAGQIIEETRKKIEENYQMVIRAKADEDKLNANGGRDVVSLENKKLCDKIDNSMEELRKFRIEFHDNLKQIKTRLAKYEYYNEQRSSTNSEMSKEDFQNENYETAKVDI
ncbi:hypothetical protein H8356DRAFT_6987 [Neocallimastix lanati (nom. inval.)]|uniref:Uncharacterized protein n=1 Tax=Neocallimastix californiae TaxID=1754190 RepID=A0A1Y2D835_9FUNG|nr:hypothetical protein H8356DRAFT_6987 [Neocallimastix sp. JGI-2020a]ORY55420.1 hypothetical protein LY90DRAFT_669692 [Neocallimastix californiae]|eukprot:ORY55420.1 hypothetical protein LY90DRAFT_669692 [Neocallimastix californiae]